MSIYGNGMYSEPKSVSFDDKAYIGEDCELINSQRIIIEALNALLEDNEDDFVTEGANLDMRAEFKKMKTEFKAEAKKVKSAIKDGRKDDAKKAVSNMKKIVKDSESKIKKIDSTAGSAIFGYFTSGFVDLARTLIWAVATFPLGGVGYIVPAVEDLINGIRVIIDDLHNNEDITNTINLYRNQILAQIKRFEGILSDLERKIDKI